VSNKCLILFALLPFLFYAQEEMDPRVFVKRIQDEIAECRQKAVSVQKATEDDWKRHSERVQALQKEADELVRQLDQLTDEIDNLQQENQTVATKNAVAQHDELRLAQLLPKDDSSPLSSRLEQLTQERIATLEELSQPPKAVAIIAKDITGKQIKGNVVRRGPVAYFSNQDGCGQLYDSPEGGLPTVHQLQPTSSQSPFILDVTGKHPELFTQQSGLLNHLRQGGVIMIPILLLGIVCIIVVLYKLLELLFHRPAKDFHLLETSAKTSSNKGEALENELFTVAQKCVTRREHLLFWLGVSASAAPLLGLLGTVTGMIHTFRLITAVGVGDARLLADGISEALVTTEAGLCVAIPALLCHAWLTRMARRHATNLEAKISTLIS
jgi:biopolymer transport protein ExbB